MGDMSIYLVQLDSGKIVRVTLPNVERGVRRRTHQLGRDVWLSWHASSPVVVTQ